jgi:MFS family permease
MSALNSLGSSKFLISIVPGLASLAFFLFTLPAGFLADTVNRKRVMICANLWLLTMAGGLGALALLNRLSPIVILATVFLTGVGFAVNAPSWAASIPDIVGEDELPSAVTLGHPTQYFWTGRTRGRGVLVYLIGPGIVFMINALGFLIVVAALLACRAPSSERVAHRAKTDSAEPTTTDLKKIPSGVKAVWILKMRVLGWGDPLIGIDGLDIFRFQTVPCS